MSSSNPDSFAAKGSFAYENWIAASTGIQLKSTLEYPLFTDTRIVDQLTDGYGPYKLLNAVPMVRSQVLLPYIILRLDYHLEYDLGQLEKADTSRYHGGNLNDEIAALISLLLGIRLKSGGYTRYFLPDKDPKGYPAAFHIHEDPTLLKPVDQAIILPQALKDQHDLKDAALLAKLPHLSPQESITVVRCARLYQDAVWIVESEPELSWLMMVSAIETAANYWRSAKASAIERLRSSKPDLEVLLLNAGGNGLVEQVANEIADYMGATKKFVDFIIEYLPTPPTPRPPGIFGISWEHKDLKKSLRKIYDWRSRALHGGVPFPMPMCMPPRKHEDTWIEKPFGTTVGKGAVWTTTDAPMLFHVFEYIVRHALINWWNAMLKKSEA